jgi:hypothetical protein
LHRLPGSPKGGRAYKPKRIDSARATQLFGGNLPDMLQAVAEEEEIIKEIQIDQDTKSTDQAQPLMGRHREDSLTQEPKTPPQVPSKERRPSLTSQSAPLLITKQEPESTTKGIKTFLHL